MLSLDYLAGYFDGEGSVSIIKVRPKTNKPFAGYGIQVSIANTYLPMLQEVQEQFGGSVVLHKKRAEHHKEKYEWSAHGQNARTFITAILPFLREKRVQAELAMSLPNDGSGNKKHADGYKEEQERIYQEVKRLKHLEYVMTDRY